MPTWEQGPKQSLQDWMNQRLIKGRLEELLGGGMKIELIIINQLVNLTLEIITEKMQAIMLIALFAINL